MNVFDIETYKDNTKVIPYCLIMIFNKKKYIFYYNEEKNIIIDFLEKIIELSDNSKKNVIFCHNINFDGLIIAEILLKSGIHFN
jgi:hypothetical protein